MSLQALIFDVDGTLAEPGADLSELARRHAGKAGRTDSLMRRTA
jgi:hydroxymethylpyrimidine pyrophosphatase-like HAD family hydrolase